MLIVKYVLFRSGSSLGVGGKYKFTSVSDIGALVVLEPPALGTEIHARLHIEKYMVNNFPAFIEYANTELGVGLRDEDLLFVSGTTKTTRWAVAAFQGDNFRNKEGVISGRLGSFTGVDFSVKFSDHFLPTDHYHTGPIALRDQDQGGSSRTALQGSQLGRQDQCLFIHYYKMKRRTFRWKSKEPIRAK